MFGILEVTVAGAFALESSHQTPTLVLLQANYSHSIKKFSLNLQGKLSDLFEAHLGQVFATMHAGRRSDEAAQFGKRKRGDIPLSEASNLIAAASHLSLLTYDGIPPSHLSLITYDGIPPFVDFSVQQLQDICI